MATNVLVTGAAGYIGGSIVADLLQSGLPHNRLHAMVRSKEQTDAVRTLGINAISLDLADETAVIETIQKLEVSIVIHTASSIDPQPAKALISGLEKQMARSRKQAHFIHTSGLSAFYPRTGWPGGEMKDTASIFDVEKSLQDSFPIRRTDVAVVEHAQAAGVKSYIVVPSTVYGRGAGPWNQLSVVLPVVVRASIQQKRVHKFAENTKVAWVHISDLTSLYTTIVRRILDGASTPNGIAGFFFAIAHEGTWHEVLSDLAKTLLDQGIVMDDQVLNWPSDEDAAETLGVPVQFLQTLWNSDAQIVAERAYTIGWSPSWNHERFRGSIEAEVKDVLELGQAKSSLLDSLHQAAKGSK